VDDLGRGIVDDDGAAAGLGSVRRLLGGCGGVRRGSRVGRRLFDFDGVFTDAEARRSGALYLAPRGGAVGGVHRWDVESERDGGEMGFEWS
jgi:hypothetical protein